jgi:aspartate/methionine/tyrosine aminotransferase
MTKKINLYTIQQWLFAEAEGRFEIDLAESGIQYHHLHDLSLQNNYDLNYSLDRGKLALREIVANIYTRPIEQVLITNGAQEGLYLFYQTFIKSGDHVITFSPGWQQSWEVPLSLGAKVSQIKLDSKNGYKIDVNEVKNCIQKTTKLLILNNPNNPTGTALDRETQDKLIALCRQNNIFILCDEEYFTDYPNSMVNQYEKCAVVSSLSKVYGFPGLRTGWFVGPADVVENVVNYKRYVTVSNSSLCEYFAIDILGNYKKYLIDYANIVNNGYKIIKNWANSLANFKLMEPQGTPFCYLVGNTDIDTEMLSKRILAEQKVLVMPAEVFEDKGALRVSFGRPSDILNEGLRRISSTLQTEF